MQPTTTTTTEMWQWQCGTCLAGWKMLRQVTTNCCPPHGDGGRGRCCQLQGTPPPPSPGAGNPVSHCHHHHHRQEEGSTNTGSGSALAAASAEGSNVGPAGRHTISITAPNHVVAEVVGCWVPDPYLMVQQLREFEPLNDELVALRVQLQEYAEEIHKSINGAGMNLNWLLALPANVRDVVILARDVIESFIAISTASAPPPN